MNRFDHSQTVKIEDMKNIKIETAIPPFSAKIFKETDSAESIEINTKIKMESQHEKNTPSKEPEPTKPQEWEAFVELDRTEEKGPFILAISQPLEYKIFLKEQKHTLIRGEPVTGLQLKAILDEIPITAPLVIIFGGGLNKFRHQVIKTIALQKFESAITMETIEAEAQTLANEEEELWLQQNAALFNEQKRKRSADFSVFRTSELMKNKTCVEFLNKIKNHYSEKVSDRLVTLIDEFTAAGTNVLYNDLLTLSASNKLDFISSVENKEISPAAMKDLLLASTKEYIFQEYTMLRFLAIENKSKCLLYLGKPKKTKQNIKKEKPSKKIKDKLSKNDVFKRFTPKLINFLLDLDDELKSRNGNRSKNHQAILRYKEYFLQPYQQQLIDGIALWQLFNVIATIPNHFARKFPGITMLWYPLIGSLGDKISKALSKAAITAASIADDFRPDEKPAKAPNMVDSDLDFEKLIEWTGCFMAIILTDPGLSGALVALNSLLYNNIDKDIFTKIQEIAMTSALDTSRSRGLVQQSYKTCLNFNLYSQVSKLNTSKDSYACTTVYRQ